MMTVDKTLISKLERLARLELSEKEGERIRQDLNEILGMVEKLDELDTEDVTPLIYMTDVVNNLREDRVKGQVDRSEALKNAPDKDDQYFKVPKVINL